MANLNELIDLDLLETFGKGTVVPISKTMKALSTSLQALDSEVDTLDTNVQANKTAIGELTELETTNKSDLVSAINEAAAGGGSSTLSGLTDVQLTSPSNGQGLIYDAESGKWVNADKTLPTASTSTLGGVKIGDGIGIEDGVINANSKAAKSDLTDIIITGTVNNTGETIARRTCFYLNGELVVAIVDINDGESFTEDTNYKRTTICDDYIRGKVLYKAILPAITPAPTNWAVIGSVSAAPKDVNAASATMFISALVYYGSGKPTGIALSTSNSETPNANNSLAFSEKEGAQAVSTMLGLGSTNNTSTVYVWAKWITSNANMRVYLNAFLI